MSAVVLAGRAGAVLALVSAALHLTLVDTSSPGSLVMAAIGLACLPCAWHLWRSPTRRVWGWVVLTDVTMLVVHVQLAASAGPMAGMHRGGLVSHLPVVLVGGQLAMATTVVLSAAVRSRSGHHQAGSATRAARASLR